MKKDELTCWLDKAYLVYEFENFIGSSQREIIIQTFELLAKNKESLDEYLVKCDEIIYSNYDETYYFVEELIGPEEETDEATGTWVYGEVSFSSEQEFIEHKNDFETLVRKVCQQIIKDNKY